MKCKLYNTKLEFLAPEKLPANTELVNDGTIVDGYYYGEVGNKAAFQSGFATRLVPVRAGITYKFKVSSCVKNANHVLFNTNKILLQKWYIESWEDYIDYTEFTPTEDGYIGVQCFASDTSISIVNVEECNKAYDWRTELP